MRVTCAQNSSRWRMFLNKKLVVTDVPVAHAFQSNEFSAPSPSFKAIIEKHNIIALVNFLYAVINSKYSYL